MPSFIIPLFAGLLFGTGLVISGMVLPSRVQGFLDVFGDFDPTLAFVMIGAIGVHGMAWAKIARERRRQMIKALGLPSSMDISTSLITGSALFGIGWGLSGFCPAPALTALVTLDPAVLYFVAAMAVGLLIGGAFQGSRAGASSKIVVPSSAERTPADV